MKKLIKKIVIFFTVCASFFLLPKLYKEGRERFCLSNIRYEETNFVPRIFPQTEDAATLNKVKDLLNQHYSYLGQGNQSYAFISEDSKYVLKFFKFGHLKQNHFFQNDLKAQEERFFKVFEGYHVAFSEDPENSALIFIHLNKTDHLKQSVTVKDRLNMSHTIDLDSVAFVLQEKVIPTREVLAHHFEKGDVEGARRKIRELFNLYITQYKKGLYDRDHNLAYNTGFKGDKAIRLDVGKFRKEPSIQDPALYKKDLEKIAFIRIKRFVSTYYPAYQEAICRGMEEDLARIFKEETL